MGIASCLRLVSVSAWQHVDDWNRMPRKGCEVSSGDRQKLYCSCPGPPALDEPALAGVFD